MQIIEIIETQEKIVLCKDCKHFLMKSDGNIEFGRCGKEALTSFVTGIVDYENQPYASHERKHGVCGNGGLNFEENK